MDMRIRYPELLKASGLTSYRIAKDSDGRVKPATIYRLKKGKGWLPTFDNDLIEVLCDAFNVEPGELWERGGKPKSRRSPSSP
jgi:DNA-binding Xre family transcriptional regulator